MWEVWEVWEKGEQNYKEVLTIGFGISKRARPIVDINRLLVPRRSSDRPTLEKLSHLRENDVTELR